MMKNFSQLVALLCALLFPIAHPGARALGQSTTEDVVAVETLPEPNSSQRSVEDEPAADALGTFSILRQPNDPSTDASPLMRPPLSAEFGGNLTQPPAAPIQLENEYATNIADVDGVDEYDVLLRGPLHEAFLRPQATIVKDLRIIAERPPGPLQEIPAAEVPKGNNVQWLDGYWGWSDELRDYVWVTGIYREVPPGRNWVAGFWSAVEGGFSWTSGYWADASAGDTVYLPAPPNTDGKIDGSGSSQSGPFASAPSEDSFWLPGYWDYVGDEYQWHDGYWTRQFDNWIWTPACHVSTPLGYVFVSGYWDYDPIYRGQVFAPVVFLTAAYLRPDYRLRPVVALADAKELSPHLFVLPGSSSYYFGNFYSNRFLAQGYQPWYVASTTFSTASLLSYYQWKYARSNLAFKDSMLAYYQFLRTTPEARPSQELVAGRLPTAADSRARGPEVTLDSVVRNRISWQAVAGASASARGLDRRSSGLGPVTTASAIRSAEAVRSTFSPAARNNVGQSIGQYNAVRSQAEAANRNPALMRSTQPQSQSTSNAVANPTTPSAAQPPTTVFERRPILSRILGIAPIPARGALPPGLAPPGMTPPFGILPSTIGPPTPPLPGFSGRQGGRRGR